MTELIPKEIKLNTMELMPETDYCDTGGRIPIQHGTGEILLWVESQNNGRLTVSAGNTVFGGKEKSFSLSPGVVNLIRLEVGPHLITGKKGDYIEVFSPGECAVGAIEMI